MESDYATTRIRVPSIRMSAPDAKEGLVNSLLSSTNPPLIENITDVSIAWRHNHAPCDDICSTLTHNVLLWRREESAFAGLLRRGVVGKKKKTINCHTLPHFPIPHIHRNPSVARSSSTVTLRTPRKIHLQKHSLPYSKYPKGNKSFHCNLPKSLR